jgi:hypothetical protein
MKRAKVREQIFMVVGFQLGKISCDARQTCDFGMKCDVVFQLSDRMFVQLLFIGSNHDEKLKTF